MAKIRLQVFLSHNGISSRRGAMDIIRSGRVRVNGQINSEPSTPIDPGSDSIEVDGRLVGDKAFEYVMLHKPAGYVTTKADRFAAKTVYDLLPGAWRHLATAGRLDKDTEGLLLFTNDGELVYKLTHPKHDVDKVYFVRLKGQLDESKKNKLERGVMIDGKKTAAAKISHMRLSINSTEFMITIHEGRKRQVRIMFAQEGYKVIFLKRLAQGPLNLGDLTRGQWRQLTEDEVRKLKQL